MGEPLFVPRPWSRAEDDGVVMSTVVDGKSQQSYLLVLNATTMEQIARVNAPMRVPYELHGEWMVPSSVDFGDIE